ncbi:hypothetical protein Zmor_019574 [Zophobas morio]|uniref:Gustatory receptor n=1 Tax=Zophobas morio TaxID=2755281 RepID=A0AA38I3W2_9CUCU|nr:hypothetical protein Zmor_019574 [Zophobas morio]
MTFKLCIKDIRCLRPFVVFLGAFLITPWYDIGENSMYKPRLAQLYGCFLISLNVLWIAYCVLNDVVITSVTLNVLHAQRFIQTVTHANLLILNTFTIIKSAFLGADDWKRLFLKLKYIDVKLQNKGKKEHTIKTFYCQVIAKQTLFAILLTYQIFFWFKVAQPNLLKFCGATVIYLYYEFLVVLLITGLVESFRSRYRDLNKKLVMAYKLPKFVLGLSNVSEDYRIMSEIVHTFNKIFGYQIIIIIVRCGFETIFAFVSFDSAASALYGDLYVYGMIYIIDLLLIVVYNFLTIIISINSTVQEAQTFVDLLYELQEKFCESSKESRALAKLISHAKHFQPKFTARGLFKLDKSVIFGVIGNVATYLIITFQLNDSERKLGGFDRIGF